MALQNTRLDCSGANLTTMMVPQHQSCQQQQHYPAQLQWTFNNSEGSNNDDDLNRHSYHHHHQLPYEEFPAPGHHNHQQQEDNQVQLLHQDQSTIPQINIKQQQMINKAPPSGNLSRDHSMNILQQQQQSVAMFVSNTNLPDTRKLGLSQNLGQAQPLGPDTTTPIASHQDYTKKHHNAPHCANTSRATIQQQIHSAEDYLHLHPTNQNLIQKHHRGHNIDCQTSYNATRLKQLTNYAVQQRQQAVASGLAAAAAEAALARHQREQQQQWVPMTIDYPFDQPRQQTGHKFTMHSPSSASVNASGGGNISPAVSNSSFSQTSGRGGEDSARISVQYEGNRCLSQITSQQQVDTIESDTELPLSGSSLNVLMTPPMATNQQQHPSRPRVNSISSSIDDGRRYQATPTSYSPVPFLTRSISFSSGASTNNQELATKAAHHRLAKASHNLQIIQNNYPPTSQLVCFKDQQPMNQLQPVDQLQQQNHHQFSSSISSPGSSTDSTTPISFYNQSPTPICGFNSPPQICDADLPSPGSFSNQTTGTSRTSGSISASDAFGLGINLEQYISKRNERERSRVRNVNDAFDNLKNSLPLEAEKMTKRMSKVEILRTAISYIRDLEGVLGSKQQQQQQHW